MDEELHVTLHSVVLMAGAGGGANASHGLQHRLSADVHCVHLSSSAPPGFCGSRQRGHTVPPQGVTSSSAFQGTN